MSWLPIIAVVFVAWLVGGLIVALAFGAIVYDLEDDE